MHTKRCSFGAFVYKDQIWVFSGDSGTYVNKEIERYDPKNDLWHKLNVTFQAIQSYQIISRKKNS